MTRRLDRPAGWPLAPPVAARTPRARRGVRAGTNDESLADGGEYRVPAGLVAQFERYAVHDGPGIRTVVYLKGCPLRCLWCHSPETQASHPELAIRGDRCIRCGTCVVMCRHGAAVEGRASFDVRREACRACGTCAAECPTGARELVGRRLTVADVVAVAERDRPFYDESGGGVTVSGGEPLAQPAFVEGLLRACRGRGIHTVVETCGVAADHVLARVALCTDLFLYDLKLMDERRHREVTGASNRPVLDNLARLVAGGARVRVRLPLVPGVNDDEENLEATARFLVSLGLRELDLLPYHRAGLAKYARLGRAYPLPNVQPPPEEMVEAAVGRFARVGLAARVGG